MGPLVICKEIRQVEGGWIVECRWPYGGIPAGFGEVVCTTWDEVVDLLTKASGILSKECLVLGSD